MITDLRYQRARAAGLDHETAITEVRLLPAPPAAQPAPTPPAPVRELAMPYSDRQAQALDRTFDMGRSAQEQAEQQRDWTELQQIDAQIEALTAPLRQRRAVIADRINRRQF